MFFAKLLKRSFSLSQELLKKNFELNITKMHLSQLHVKIGMASLNNDPLDFSKNFKNIMKSIQMCKDLGCSVRVGS